MSAILRYIRENRLGATTLFLSLSFTFLGLPAQIYKIFITQSAKDVSPFTFFLLALQSFFWVLYGAMREKKDWVIIIPNAFVVLFAVIILLEYFLFQ